MQGSQPGCCDVDSSRERESRGRMAGEKASPWQSRSLHGRLLRRNGSHAFDAALEPSRRVLQPETTKQWHPRLLTRATTAEHGAICDIKDTVSRHREDAESEVAVSGKAEQSIANRHEKGTISVPSELGRSVGVFRPPWTGERSWLVTRLPWQSLAQRARILRRFRCVSQMAQIAAVGSLPRGPFANAAVRWHWKQLSTARCLASLELSMRMSKGCFDCRIGVCQPLQPTLGRP